MWAVIGGSGFEHFDGFETVSAIDPETPFGQASSGIKRVRINGVDLVFVSRHGEHHELLPSEVNYRANIFALKREGVTKLMATSAVGSLKKELKPGDLVIPTQYIDRTKSLREHTFCGSGVVGHVSHAHPVHRELVEALKQNSHLFDFSIHFYKTYVCIEGPGFSTQAESNSYRSLGADIIGMTHYPEYALAREAGLVYFPCCFVTDYDCWDDSIAHVTLEEVVKVMKNNNAKAFKLASVFIAQTMDLLSKGCPELGLQSGLMTPWDSIPKDKQNWLRILRD